MLFIIFKLVKKADINVSTMPSNMEDFAIETAHTAVEKHDGNRNAADHILDKFQEKYG